MDGYNKGLTDATTTETNTAKAMRVLREATRAQALQRNTGRLDRIRAQKILQSRMRRISTFTGESYGSGISETVSKTPSERVPDLRVIGQSASPSYQRGYYGQLAPKLDDAVRFMPYEVALGQRENDFPQTYSLPDLRRAIGEIKTGALPETLSAIQEVWESLSDKEKAWVRVRASQHSRLEFPFPSRPNEPQHAYEPSRTTDVKENRVARIRALGNAVVPQQVYPFAVAIKAFLDGGI